MNEIDAIKARAAERRNRVPDHLVEDDPTGDALVDAEDDLDRAIGIALGYADGLAYLAKQRDEYKAAIDELNEAFRTTADQAGELATETDKLRAAALALREVVGKMGAGAEGIHRVALQLLEDTEWLEEYR